MKSTPKHQPAKFPVLRCPECSYEYQPSSHGWAFRTDEHTKCVGHPDTRSGPIPSGGDAFHHPFQVVGEDPGKEDSPL